MIKLLMGMPRWSVVLVNDHFIVISDMKLLGCKSVANGIDYVLAELSKEHDLSKKALIFRDSFDVYDAVAVDENGLFEDYLYLGTTCHIEAMDLYEALYM